MHRGCFPGGGAYSQAAGFQFRTQFLGPMAVDVARDHGTEGGYLWAMEEESEVNRPQDVINFWMARCIRPLAMCIIQRRPRSICKQKTLSG